MKIAMIGQKGIPALYGGVEQYVEQLSLQLAKRDYDVTVYTRPYYTSKHQTEYHGISLFPLPSLRTKHFDAITHTLLATFHAVKDGADVFHYHGVGPALLAFIPRLLRPQAKVIVTFQCLDRKHQKWGLFARYVLWLGERAAVYFPHQTIVVSRTLQQYCRTQFGRETLYIPNGIPLTVSKPADAELVRQRFGLAKDSYILAVARLIPHKGIHYLIDAYKQLRTDKRLVIVGDGVYTDAYVQKLKTSAGDDPRILFTGFQSGATLKALFANACIFVQPSETEGLSIALLEAAGLGTCVLASDIPENLEVLHTESQTIGYTFRSKDSDDLEKKLQELLADPVKRQAIGHFAQTVVRKHYAWPTLVHDIEKIYTSVKKPALMPQPR